MRVEHLTVLAPCFFVNVDVRQFPARLAEVETRRRAVLDPFGQFLPDKAMLSVGLPVDVEGELQEGAKAFLAVAECFLGEHLRAYIRGYAAIAYKRATTIKHGLTADRQVQWRTVGTGNFISETAKWLTSVQGRYVSAPLFRLLLAISGQVPACFPDG